MRPAWLVATLLLACLALACSPPTYAESATVVVRAPREVFLVVDGERYYGQSVKVSLGSRVCVADEYVYTSPSTRYVFSLWLLNGRAYSSSACVDVAEAGTYEALYLPEHLVVVASDPPLFAETFWVREGGTLNYTAPLEVRGGDAVYRFARWDSPLLGVANSVSFVVTGPAVLRAVYVPHYPLYVNGTLVGYFPSGYTYVLRVEPRVLGDARLEVERLTVLGGTSTYLGGWAYAVTVGGPTYVIPVYARYYRVTVRTLNATSEYWVREGEQLRFTAQSVVELVDARFVFKGWRGDVVTHSPVLEVEVRDPTYVEAVYSRQFRVVVKSPTGEKTAYVNEGADFYHYEPPELPAVLVGRVLTGFLVNGETYRPVAPGVLVVRGVSSPLTVVAVYEYRVSWVNVAVVAGFLVLAVASYSLLTRKKG